MLSKQDVLDMAEAYRDMASKAPVATWRLEFAERAERYETIAAALKQRERTPQKG